MSYLLVIDGDNISTKDFEDLINGGFELNSFSEKIVYGDLTRTENKKWYKFCLEYNFTFHHCAIMKKNKNVTDLHMFIEASERLFKMNYNGIYISTNDGDFSILGNLWKKYNKEVYFICNKNHSKFLDFFDQVILPDKNLYPELKHIIKDGLKRGIKLEKSWSKLIRKTYPNFKLEDFECNTFQELIYLFQN